MRYNRRTIAYIRGQDAFGQMIKMEGTDKLMDNMPEGRGKFTDAFINAMNDVAGKHDQPVGKDPKDVKIEEKTEVRRNNKMPV